MKSSGKKRSFLSEVGVSSKIRLEKPGSRTLSETPKNEGLPSYELSYGKNFDRQKPLKRIPFGALTENPLKPS